MIFDFFNTLKQLPQTIQEINQLGHALNSLQELNTQNNGIDLTSINDYREALEGLGLDQSVFALLTEGATEQQIQQILVTEQATASDVEAAIGRQTLAIATNANTASIERQTLAEEDELLAQWLLIGGEEADTIATNANTASKMKNLSIVNILKAAYVKLTTAMASNPFMALAIGVGIAITAIASFGAYLSKAEERAKETSKTLREEVEKLKSEIKNINSELQTTKNRIDELNGKKNLSLIETEELKKLKETNDELERELRVKEALARREGKKANEASVEYFTKKTYQESTVTGIGGAMDYQYFSNVEQVEKKQNEIANKKQALKEIKKEMQTIESENENFEKDSGWKLLDVSYKRIETELEQAQKFVDEQISSFMEEDDSLIEGMDESLIERLNSIYQKQDEIDNGVAQSHTNTISAVLDKVNFQKTREELIKLGEDGKLSVDVLSTKFKSLTNYLTDAGVSAEELYQYIMNIVDPDVLKFQELRYQLQDALGFNDGVDSPMNIELDKRLQEEGLYTEEGLTAFATIKAKYVNGETVLWTVEDWIGNIQSEMDSKNTGIEVSTTLSATLTKAKDKLDELQSSISNVQSSFTTLMTGDYSSGELLDSLQSITEAMSSMGVDDFDWNVLIGDGVDSLEILEYAMGRLSEQYLKSFLADNNIDSNSNFAKMLQNVYDEAVKVEAPLNSVNKSFDNIQDAYKTMTEAVEEYNETGYLTLDTLQAVISLDNKYIKCLVDENGQISLNTDAYKTLIAAKLDDAKNTVIQKGIQDLENVALETSSINADAAAESTDNFIEKIKSGIQTAKNFVASLLGIATAEEVVDKVQDGTTLEDAYEKASKVNKQAADDVMKSVEAQLTWIDSVASNISGGFGNIMGNNSDSSKDAKEASKEVFDFIEIAIQRIESAIEKLRTKAEDTFRSFKSRSKDYVSLMQKTTVEIELQQKAYSAYLAKANSIGLEESWAVQVRNGSLNIAEVTDDNLKEKINDYQTWYEKAVACSDKLEELNRTQKELTQAKIELVITKYEKLAEKVESANSRISNWVGIKEAWGFSGSKNNYTDMNKNIQKQISYTEKQNEELKKLQKTVVKGSEAWYEYNNRINSNRESLQDMKLQMAENTKAASELAKATADKKVEKLDSKDEMNDAKIDNALSAKSQNSYINKKMSNINKRQNAYDIAVKTDTANLNKTKSSLNKFKATKENKSVLASIKQRIKSGKRISESLLTKAYNLKDNGKLYNACMQYNAYFDARISDKEIADLFRETSIQEKADLAMQKFENIGTEYDNSMHSNQQKKTEINNKIAYAEESGRKLVLAYYKGLISSESGEYTKLVNKRNALQKSLEDSLANGSIKQGSEEWFSMISAIDEVKNAIDESTLSLKEYQNAMRQLKWDTFDTSMETVKHLNSESDFFIDFMSKNKQLINKDNGDFTEYGESTLGLYNTNYLTYLAQFKQYEKEYNELLAQIEKGQESLDDEKVVARLRELQDAMHDSKLGAEDMKKAIVDLVRQVYDAQLAALQKMIEQYKSLKDYEKEAYEYQKQIAEKTKSIATLQKQLAAWGQNDTEESRSKIQSIKVKLEKSKEDLKETEYNKMLSDTENMLDNLYGDYEEFIDEKLENVEQVIKDAIGGLSTDIIATLVSLNAGVLTDEFKDVLSGKITIQEYANKIISEDKKTIGQSDSGTSVTNSVEETARVKSEADAKKKAEEEAARVAELQKQKKDIQEQISNLNAKLRSEEQKANQAIKNAKTKKEEQQIQAEFEARKQDLKKQISSLENKLNSLPAHRKGTKYAKDGLAWTQEEGSEIIYRKSDGAMLTPLGMGDKVFTSEMSENLWKLAQVNPFDITKGLTTTSIPNFGKGNVSEQVTVSVGDIVMNGVNDPETFGKQLRDEICKNGKTTNCIAEAVSAKQLGKGLGNAKMFR